jgi:hypothetical protein
LLKDALLRCAQARRHRRWRALLCHAIDDRGHALLHLSMDFAPSAIEPMTLMPGLKAIANAA